ncbi:hypothetical protein [Streptomyces sp. B5E4]|uniref:hypothetical protein n=1 Tax=Streptomyces sp. B5E4 TaxID=3153568 RepID=UPI00325F1704
MAAHHGGAVAGTFAVARGRNEGYRVLSAPEFLGTGTGVLTDLVSADHPDGDLFHGQSPPHQGQSVHVTYTSRALEAGDLDEAALALLGSPPRDGFGRPLRIVYGIVRRSPAPDSVPPAWIRRAEQDALEAFRAFAADEAGYRLRTSPPLGGPAGHAPPAAAAESAAQSVADTGAESGHRTTPAGAQPEDRPRSRQLTASTWITVTLTFLGVGFGGWAILEAHRANEQSDRANRFDQRGASSAVITSPQVAPDECLPVHRENPPALRGTATMAKGATLWEITQPVNDSSLWPGPRARTRAASSSWTMRIPSVGAAGDKGHEYMILLVAADPTASKELEEAAAAKKYEPLQKMPEGAEILAEMCVRRVD